VCVFVISIPFCHPEEAELKVHDGEKAKRKHLVSSVFARECQPPSNRQAWVKLHVADLYSNFVPSSLVYNLTLRAELNLSVHF